jgi:hypothetical protein
MRRTISGMTAAPLSTLCFVAVVAPTCPPTNMPPSSPMILIHGKEGGQHSTSNLKSLSENFERQLNFGLKPALSPALSMNLDFMVVQTVLVYGLHSQLVVTTALILTFSPEEKGQRLHASLHAVVRRANPVAFALWFRGRRFCGFGHGESGKIKYWPLTSALPRFAGEGAGRIAKATRFIIFRQSLNQFFIWHD